jgi:HlyD family secretion protein
MVDHGRVIVPLQTERARRQEQEANVLPLTPAPGAQSSREKRRIQIRGPQLLLLIAVTGFVLGAFVYWQREEGTRVPAGFARSNGRIEVERTDVATKTAGRVAQVLVQEGDLIAQGGTIARMDAAEIEARRAALAAALRRATEAIDKAEAALAVQVAQKRLAELELGRATSLESGGVGSHATADERRAQFAVAQAMVASAKADVADALAARAAAQANLGEIDATIADLTLTAPVAGRIEYRLAREGEVLAAGGKVVTLLDLADAYMTVFLPTSESGRAAIGAEARVVLDATPNTVLPAIVSFVSSEAEFTPKTVETGDEREKLMYRVKLRFDPALLESHRNTVKAGVTGLAYVKLDPAARWPDALAVRLPIAP